MPYIVVVREDIELNYFIEGLDKDVWDSYEDRNLQKIDVADLEDAKDNLKPVRFSAELNRYNYNMPVSGYKKDLEEDQENELVVAVEDLEGFVDSDRDDVGYGDDIYYIEQEKDIVYKIPLKILINRYLPKATLLTAWYMIKQDDPTGSGFKIDEMMDDIKGIYNAACYTANSFQVEEIKTTGKKDSETGKINTNVPQVTLRTKAENQMDFTVSNAIQFDEKGNIKRDENGKAILSDKQISYANTNFRTFIYFEQFGLENSVYEAYVAYRGPSGDLAPNEPDEARPEAISPSATYLTRDKVNFIKQLNLTVGKIKYIGDDGTEHTIPSKELRLKPTYILDSGLDEGSNGEFIDEKLKSLYNFRNKCRC